MRVRLYEPPTRVYPTDLKRLGLDRQRADIYCDRPPVPCDFVVFVDGSARAVDPQSGRLADGPRINRRTKLRFELRKGSDLIAGVDQSLGVAKVPTFLLDVPGFLEVGAAFPVFTNEHGVAYTKRQYPGTNTITVAQRYNGNGVNVKLWEVSLVNQALVNPRGGRSMADNWFVQIRDIADESDQHGIYFPTASELNDLEPNVGILSWWMPAGLCGKIVTRNRDGQYPEYAVHYNGWRREVYNGRVALPLWPNSGAHIHYTTVREDEYVFAEAAGLSFV